MTLFTTLARNYVTCNIYYREKELNLMPMREKTRKQKGDVVNQFDTLRRATGARESRSRKSVVKAEDHA